MIFNLYRNNILKRLWVFALCLSFIGNVSSHKKELDSIFAELDKVMDNQSFYVKQKEKQIIELKKMFQTPDLSLEQSYQINSRLHKEYNYYQPDSAKLFLYDNIQIAEQLNSHRKLIQTRLSLIGHYALEGLYIHAVNALDSIRSEADAEGLIRDYYSTYKLLYYFYSSMENKLPAEYFLYQDSLLSTMDKQESLYALLYAEKLMDAGRWEESRDMFLPLFEIAENGSHTQAMLANCIAKTYWAEKNYDMQKKYFAISAIADMKNAIRQHESFRSLAIVCYETNDIKRAYQLISQSVEDALSTNFAMRLIETSRFFPIIEKAYQQKIQEEKKRFLYLSVLTGIMVLFLIIGLLYLYKQMKNLAMIRKNLAETNRQLSKINEEIVRMNNDLSEANLLKETYIAQFLNVCSLYVSKLEKFQNMLNKKAMDRQLEELYRILKSRDMIDNELKELYGLFDKIFLNLYPDFVQEINRLLPANEHFLLKKGNTMSAELRIFALIRLGITDSCAIAEFLHYSIKTIYNYRTRLRNKTLVPSEEFEDRIKHIGMKKDKR